MHQYQGSKSRNSRAFCTKIILSLFFVHFFCASLVSAADLVSDPQAVSRNAMQHAQVAEIDLLEKNTDVFYLRARLGDADESEFLLDTGSGYLAISEDELAKLKQSDMARYERGINARLANGQVKRVSIYIVDSLDLGGGCVLHNVEAAVLPGATRNIIGMNVLKMVGNFSISFNPSKLTLSDCSVNTAEAVASL